MAHTKTRTTPFIYFSEGPYIELLEKAPVSQLTLWALKGIGQGQVAKRLRSWADAPPGFFELCLETKRQPFKNGQSPNAATGATLFLHQEPTKDPQQRLLQWQLLFPHNTALPFIMTPFNTNPKPQNLVHPNGKRRSNNAPTTTLQPIYKS